MENYYLLFNINPTDSIEEIEKRIEEEQKKCINRMNSPKLERQLEAKNKLALLDEAKEILLDIDEKEKYDRNIENSSSDYETQLEPQYQSTPFGEASFNTDESYSEKLDEIIDLWLKDSTPLALKEIKHLIESYPDSAELWEWSGTLKKDFGNPEEAELDFMTSINIDPTYENSYLGLAYIYLYDYRDYEEGKKRLDQALKINPASIGALRTFGEIYYQANNLEDALVYYKKLEYYYPENEEYIINIKEINQKLSIKRSEYLYNKSKKIYRNKYFESESQVNEYIQTLDAANKYHPEAPYQTEINKAKSKLKLSVDFKYLSLLLIPLILGTYLLNGAGVLGILLFSVVTSIILFNGICPKWKIEKRRATPIVENTLISLGLKFLGGLNLIMLLSLIAGSARLVGILILLAAAVYYVGYPKWKEKKALGKVN